MTLDKLNDGATLESLKAKLRSYSYTKRTNISADHASCFYSNGKDFGSLQVKTHSRFSGSLHTTQEVNLSIVAGGVLGRPDWVPRLEFTVPGV